MGKNVAIPGDHNMRCDRCGVKAKRSELVYDAYYGLWVHPRHYDGQHPLDRLASKIPEDEESVPLVEAEPADRFSDTDVNGGTVGSTPTTYEGSVATGDFDDQDDNYAQHPESNDAGVVLVSLHVE